MCLVAQSYLTLCGPLACSPPGSSVRGILQARITEWVTIPFSRDLPDAEIESRSPALLAVSLPSEPPGNPWELQAGFKSELGGCEGPGVGT